MEHLWIGFAGVFLLVLGLAAGVYITVVLGLVSMLGLIAIIGISPTMSLLATTFFHFGSMYEFIVAPLFVAMGLLATEAGVSNNLYDMLSKWVGHIKGGLGLATVAGCAMFGALTGSSVVTSMVFAKVSVPVMKQHGYDAKLGYGLVCGSGVLGMLIPPSLLAVVYALITEESLGRLLLGGIGPAIVMALCLGTGLIVLLYLRPSLGPSTRGTTITWRERFSAVPKAWPVFVLGTIIIGGIYLGVFTVIEAAGVGTFVLLVLRLFVMGFSRRSLEMLTESLRETVSLTAMMVILITAANLFGRFLMLSGLGPMITNSIIAMNLSPVPFLIMISLWCLLMGCFIDAFSIAMITLPLIYPVVVAMRLDFVWFAMTMIVAIEIGLLTPPFGLTIFVVKGIAGEEYSVEDLFKGSIPFTLMQIVALAIIIAFPSISTWIPYHALEK